MIVNDRKVIIHWSDEDQAFIAACPELPGCLAHGSSREEALRNVREAMALWIETALADGEAVPAPNSHWPSSC